MYAGYPLLPPSGEVGGDLHFNNDFRMLYSTILDDFTGIAPEPIVTAPLSGFQVCLQRLVHSSVDISS